MSLFKKMLSQIVEVLLEEEHPEIKAQPQLPPVIPIEHVKQAVAEFLGPMIQNEVPVDQGFEPPPSAEEMEYNRKVMEAMRRAGPPNAMEEPPGTYDPNMPGNTPWASAKVNREG